MMIDILQKIHSKESTVGVVGLGYAGLPIALRFADVGFKVIGIDKDVAKVETLNAKKNPFVHMNDNEVEEILNKNFLATFDFSLSSKCDAIILCLPTPIDLENKPDLSYVESTMESLKPFHREGQLIVLESTTYPGTTEELLKPSIESAGFVIGENFFLGYSPEREDPGNLQHSTKSIPKVCAGVTSNCLKIASALYSHAVDSVVEVSSPAAAEMSKLLENIYRAVNIGLINEMKIIANAMNIDIHEVIAAAATKPFGFTPFYPGPGLGGHCIPVDPFYLSWKAEQIGLSASFIELSGKVNKEMPKWVLRQLKDALEKQGNNNKSPSVLVLGLSYKKNIDDLRESPSIELMELLRADGYRVSYSDPFTEEFPPMRHHKFDLKSEVLDSKKLSTYDAVILSTDHDDFDFELIKNSSKLVLDTRGVYKGSFPNIIKA
jgi:UDP-N-acetyl-D-glucosamine dehydrogenase